MVTILFSYARAPHGYGSSNDGYKQRTDTILRNCPEKPEKPDYDKIVEDTILSNQAHRQLLASYSGVSFSTE